jgi:hypothetical protein
VPAFSESPFAILTAIVAPAVLTNACSVLALGTSNRIARVVDRTRIINAELASPAASAEYENLNRQSGRLRVRADMLLKALRIIYAALGGFAASALISVVGGVVVSFNPQHIVFDLAGGIALLVGTFAVAALVSGCSLLFRETRLALLSIAEEEALARKQYQARLQGAKPI